MVAFLLARSYEIEGFLTQERPPRGRLQRLFTRNGFEDQVDNEKVYVHAQKDMETDVLNDSITHIGHDQHRQIDNDHFTQIGGENGTGNDHLTIKGESRHKIGKDHTLMVNGSLQQKVGSKAVLDAGNEIHLSSGVKLVVNAGAELTLKAGGSFLKIDGSGVHLVGSAINLNSGGGAGSGSGFSGVLPELPLSVVSPEYDANLEAPEGNEAPIVVTAALKHQLISDQLQNEPVTEVCQKRADGTCPLGDCPCGNN